MTKVGDNTFLYYTYLLRLRVESILYVTFSHNLQMPDDLDGCGSQDVVLHVGQGLAGCHHDGLARVDTEGIYILHVANLQ